MENMEEKNSPAEQQASDELNTEELEAVSGGGVWDDIKEGVRDAGQGLADGLRGENSGESNLNYLGGNVVGGVIDSVGSAITRK
ncbi:hypothetical protein [Nostoc sp.]|uniref:hypothetical protein n=1 Tax=Nostoc sp. TaxID=1180 RepID=UPI002FF7108A